MKIPCMSVWLLLVGLYQFHMKLVTMIMSPQSKPSTTSSKIVLKHLKGHLSENTLYVSPATSGFVSVLHGACYYDHVSVSIHASQSIDLPYHIV